MDGFWHYRAYSIHRFTAESTVVNEPDNPSVVYLLEPATKRCLNCVICNLGVNRGKENLSPAQKNLVPLTQWTQNAF